MANWHGASRSNYFKVKDAKVFKAWADTLPGLGVWTLDDSFGVYGDAEGYWPSSRECEESGDYLDIDFVSELAEHLADGSICVLMTAGAEKLRYLTGYACAFDNTGKVVDLSLNSIYGMAKAEFGITPTLCSY